MRRLPRLLFRSAVVLTAAAALGLVASLEPVDYRPHFQQPYYRQTRDRLAAQTNDPVLAPVAAGFGRALMTPRIGAPADDPASGRFRALPLAGYGDRDGRPASGVHDDLYCKAAAFRVADRVVVMAAADALIIPAEVADLALDRLKRELRLTREQVYLGAAHTHCGIGGWGEGFVAEAFAGGFQPGAREWFADRLVAAVLAAVADLQPAAIGSGSFSAPGLIRNRLVGELGRVDSEFNLILVRQEGGATGIIGSFGAHATVLSGSMTEFSGDYPGFWQREVEAATSGTAIFFAGGVGSHSPVPPERGIQGAERMGRTLARASLECARTVALTNRIAFGACGLQMVLPSPHLRLAEDVRLRPWLARRLVPMRPETFIQALRLGDAVWVSTPCDFSGELALDLKDFAAARGFRAVATSFNGDYIGYVIPARYYRLGGYEPQIMSFYGPAVPHYMDDMLRGLVGNLTRRPARAE